MKKKLLCSLGITVAAAALTTGPTPPASADTTDVTFTLEGGGLSVSVQPTATWGEKGASGSTSMSGSLGEVKVTDTRGGTAGWSVGAATSTFTDGTTTATAVSYNPGLPALTGVVVPVPALPKTLTASSTEVMSATGVVGNNTVTWNPTLTVTLPSSSTAGKYTGTITTSLL
jgi:hypothetical protein